MNPLARTAVTAQASVLKPERTWIFGVDTDTSEDAHTVLLAQGRLTCSCRGFVEHRTTCCNHIKRVKEILMNEESTALVTRPAEALTTYQGDSPVVLYERLETMKLQRRLVHDFLQSVMIPGEDYATLSDLAGNERKKGEKAVLLKPGAEKLCELYGYAPTLVSLTETPDYETGHYRVQVVVGLIQKGTGIKVAEGVGECSTRESKYAYRWIGADQARAAVGVELLKTLKSRTRTGRNGDYTQYRLDNEDLHDVWNTILKMAKKRALVDATLTATSASGVFGQAAQELDEWIEGEFTEVPGPAQTAPDAVPSRPAAARPNAVPPRQQRQAQHPHPAAQQAAAPAPAREPTSASDWLNAIGSTHGQPAKLQGIAVMERAFGTAVVTQLQQDDLKAYIRMLQVRHAQTPHDHLASPAVGATGEYFCTACGEGIDPQSVEAAAGITPELPDDDGPGMDEEVPEEEESE